MVCCGVTGAVDMNPEAMRRNWDELGKTDPLWAILTRGDKRGGKWEADEFFKTGVDEISGVMERLKAWNIELPTGRALDFGCGVGRLTQALVPYFDEIHGVDIAPSMIEHARRFNRRPDKCHYSLNEHDDLCAFPDNSFDLVYTSIVLQHIEPKYARKYVREFLRIVSPSGLLIFQLPCEQIRGCERQSLRLNMKRFAKRLTPAFALRWYRKLLNRPEWDPELLGEPCIAMYFMKEDEVRRLLHAGGATILNTVHDISGWFHSIQYYVSKSQMECASGACRSRV